MKRLSANAALVSAVVMLLQALWMPVFAEPQLIEEPEISTRLKLPIIEWKDDDVPTKGIVFAIHGLTLHAKTLDTTGRFLASKGYPTYAMDMRGMGKWRTDPEKFEGNSKINFSLIKSDLSRSLHALRETYPDKPLLCMGESLGATLSVRVAENEPELIDGIIASSFCDKRLWKHFSWRMIPDLARGFALPWVPVCLNPYSSKLLSTDKRVTQAYLDDPLILHSLTGPRVAKTLLENKRVERHVAKIPQDMPILIVSGGRDLVGDDIPKYIKELNFRRLKFRSLPKQGHLLLECQPEMNPDTAACLQGWLDKQVMRTVAINRTQQ